MKSIVASSFEIVGIGAVTYGLWLYAPWLGIAVGGAGLVLLGLAIDPPDFSGRDES